MVEQRTLHGRLIPGLNLLYPDQNWTPFQSAEGYDLHTYRYPASGEKRGLCIMIHGLHSYIDMTTEMAKQLSFIGVETCGFDMPGHGKSSGPRGIIENWENRLLDCERFIDKCMELNQGLPVFLSGGSMGCVVAA